jgi:hypothetical protein
MMKPTRHIRVNIEPAFYADFKRAIRTKGYETVAEFFREKMREVIV